MGLRRQSSGRDSATKGSRTVLGALAIALMLSAAPLAAGTCNVPGSHATIQQAVLDSACTTIDLVATTYNESIEVTRSLTLNGPGGGGAVIEGLVTVSGTGTQVAMNNLAIQNGCTPDGIRADGQAELTGTNLSVTSNSTLPCPIIPFIFSDGFESSDTSAWSAASP